MATKTHLLFLFLVCLPISCGKQDNSPISPGTPDPITWTRVGPDSILVTSIACHPNGTIFAGIVNGSQKLIRSSDNGEHWTEVGVPPRLGSFYINVITIDNSGQIFASSYNGISSQLLVSSDLGMTWRTAPVEGTIRTIACDSLGGVYVGTAYGDESAGSIQFSTDMGYTWSHANLSTTVGVENLMTSRRGTIIAVRGPGGVIRSTDRGWTWTQSDSGMHGEYLATLATNSEGILFGTASPNRVLRSTDDGISWTQAGLIDALIEQIAIDGKNQIFAATGYAEPKGVFRSTDDGATWTACDNTDLEDEWILSLAVTPSGYLFIGTWNHGLLRSMNPTTQ
jgi:photosystem II stability/assembly factor-like uncharacterized protein